MINRSTKMRDLTIYTITNTIMVVSLEMDSTTMRVEDWMAVATMREGTMISIKEIIVILINLGIKTIDRTTFITTSTIMVVS